MTDLLQFTKSFRKFPRQHDCALQLECEERVLLVWVNLYVFAGAAASKMHVSNSSLVSTFLL